MLARFLALDINYLKIQKNIENQILISESCIESRICCILDTRSQVCEFLSSPFDGETHHLWTFIEDDIHFGPGIVR